MDFLPITLRIHPAHILLVGGGKVATHKAEILHRFTDHVTVIAPRISESLKALPFHWKEKAFEPDDLQGVNLLFVCTDDPELNRRIYEEAHERGILTSVCDNPALCDFVSPAIFRQENLTIAVGSDAQDVRRSIRVRNNIKKLITHDILSID